MINNPEVIKLFKQSFYDIIICGIAFDVSFHLIFVSRNYFDLTDMRDLENISTKIIICHTQSVATNLIKQT